MSTNKVLFWIIILILLALVALCLRPLPNATINNCTFYKGTIQEISLGGGEGDIVFELANDKNIYYINRGTESGLQVELLKKELVGRAAEIMAIRHWTPLDPTSRSKHIAKLTCNGSLIYSEIE